MGTRSWVASRRDQQVTQEIMQGVEMVHVAKMWPFTDDMIDLPQSHQLIQKEEVLPIEPYQEPAPPFLDHISVDYLQNFISFYQLEMTA